MIARVDKKEDTFDDSVVIKGDVPISVLVTLHLAVTIYL